MTENTTKDFIDNLAQGKNDDAGEAFKNALRGKVGDSLDQMRKDLAGNLFNGDGTVNTDNAAPHSDPKPEIEGTGTFTQDGQVEPTCANAVEPEVSNEAEPVSAEQPDVQQ